MIAFFSLSMANLHCTKALTKKKAHLDYLQFTAPFIGKVNLKIKRTNKYSFEHSKVKQTDQLKYR